MKPAKSSNPDNPGKPASPGRPSLDCGLRFAAIPLLCFALYAWGLPSTVQTADSGELAANAYNLDLLHPPGYPLMAWLASAFTHLLPWGSVFCRAALLNAVLAAAALGFLAGGAGSAGRARLVAAAVALTLATSRCYWRAAVVPDVFALHLLISSALLAVYLSPNPRRWRSSALIILFFAGLANHQTIVFLLPLVLDAALTDKNRARVVASTAIGAAVCAALYASLDLMHGETFGASGRIASLADFVAHVTRASYGTFRLTGQETATPWWTRPVAFAHALASDFLPTIALGAVSVLSLVSATAPKAREPRRRLALVALCLSAYCAVFLPLMNLPDSPAFVEIAERFYAFPALILSFLAVGCAAATALPPRRRPGTARAQATLFAAALAAAAIVVALDLARYRARFDLSRNTIVEDYAINLLRATEAPRGSPAALLLVDADDKYFAALYAQSILGVAPSTLVFSTGNVFSPLVLEKARRRAPDFSVDLGAPSSDGGHDVGSGFIAPNAARHAIYGGFDAVPAGTRATILELGRRFTLDPNPGRRPTIEPTTDDTPSRLLLRSRPSSEPPADEDYDRARALFADYAFLPLARGLVAYRAGRLDDARASFERALELVPYSVPARQNLCTVLGKQGLDSPLCGH